MSSPIRFASDFIHDPALTAKTTPHDDDTLVIRDSEDGGAPKTLAIGDLPAGGVGDIQTLLDGISSVQGTVLYRGASAWVALAPGTSGHVLQTQGAGADPQWAAGASGAWVLIDGWTHSSDVATVDFDVTGYSEILVDARLLTASSSGQREILVSTDGVAFFNTSGDYVFTFENGTEDNAASILLHSTASNLARSGYFMGFGINLSGTPKRFEVSNRVANATGNRLFVADTDPIVAVRVRNSAGNLTGGSIFVLGR